MDTRPEQKSDDENTQSLTAHDFELAVQDMIRVSLTAKNVRSVMAAVRALEQERPGWRVVGRKNTFLPEANVAPSQYRDIKLLVEVTFDGWEGAVWNDEVTGQKVQLGDNN